MTSRASILTLEDPYVSQHGGTMRTRAFQSALVTAGCDVTVLFPKSSPGMRSLSAAGHADPAFRERALKHLGALKRRALPMPTEWGARSPELSHRLVASDPDLLLISVLAQAPFRDVTDAPLWLDFMDVWSDFAKVEARHRRGLFAATAHAQSLWLRRRERVHGVAATVTTAAGWRDAELLKSRGLQTHWIPTPLPDDDFRRLPRHRSVQSPPVAGFLGNFEYWPNRDAVTMLVEQWAGPLRQSGWSIVVAGRHSDRLEIAAPNVTVIGPVNDVDEFYAEVDATVAPIRLGGGMKVKVLESLSRGRPAIGTTASLEGFPPEVRRLCVEVGQDARSVPALSALQAVDPGGARLLPFHQSQVSARIHDLLREIGAA